MKNMERKRKKAAGSPFGFDCTAYREAAQLNPKDRLPPHRRLSRTRRTSRGAENRKYARHPSEKQIFEGSNAG